ncbi:MAG: hypothetical protein M5U01_24125 [Ardenticatenaceae bacterium]|nr:hypothetical protein [Ardenticatenaceae bacterium]
MRIADCPPAPRQPTSIGCCVHRLLNMENLASVDRIPAHAARFVEPQFKFRRVTGVPGRAMAVVAPGEETLA